MKNSSIYEIFSNAEHSVTIMEFEYKRVHTPLHWHNNFEILCCLDGALNVLFKDKSIVAHKGDFIFINQYELHEIPATEAHYICVVIPSDIFSFLNFNQKYKINNLINDTAVSDYMMKTVEIIMKNYETFKSQIVFKKENRGVSLEIYGYLYLMFAHVLKNYSEKIKSDNGNYDILNACQNIIKYILEHYQEKIMIDDLIKLSYINKQSLQKHFKNITGTTIKAYILDTRIKRAHDLLVFSKKSITDIAFECGFDDSNYFSRAVKKHLGMSPSEIRKKHAENDN